MKTWSITAHYVITNLPEKSALTKHIYFVHFEHERKKYQCKVCNKEYADKSGLNRHKKSAHEGVTYKCKTCDAQFTQKESISTHMKSKHQGVKYPCGLCNFEASQKSNLYKHNKSVHQMSNRQWGNIQMLTLWFSSCVQGKSHKAQKAVSLRRKYMIFQ